MMNLIVAAAAEGSVSGIDAIRDTLQQSFLNASDGLLAVVSGIIPSVIPVMIGMTTIGVAIRVFKKVAGK